MMVRSQKEWNTWYIHPIHLFSIIIIVSIIFLTLVVLYSGQGNAATIVVDAGGGGGGGGSDYTSIQEAIDHAEPGDEILVKEGVYNESITIDKTLNLTGKGPRETIIDAGESNAIVITAPSVNLTGFKIVGSLESHDGIRAESNFNRITDVATFDNRRIFLNRSAFNILQNITSSNNTQSAIYLIHSDFNTIINASMTGSENGINCYESDHNTISLSNLSGNNNGITLKASSFNKIKGCMVLNNTHAGITIKDASRYNDISGSVISGNHDGIILGQRETGIIFSESNSIENVTISENERYGVHIQYANKVTINKATITGNTQGIYDEGIGWYCEIHTSNLFGNSMAAVNTSISYFAPPRHFFSPFFLNPPFSLVYANSKPRQFNNSFLIRWKMFWKPDTKFVTHSL